MHEYLRMALDDIESSVRFGSVSCGAVRRGLWSFGVRRKQIKKLEAGGFAELSDVLHCCRNAMHCEYMRRKVIDPVGFVDAS